eukprot:TRINITY_DN19357_c0_g1_i1.p1 TRINITY_DN19357_c0_g1~~TRINITY_DN19357_c0_g1_i1.p1  ORF type:complete len:580 (+),score=179.10 TRINITY_DN19357_c0_g1_i1:47-1786(+)
MDDAAIRLIAGGAVCRRRLEVGTVVRVLRGKGEGKVAALRRWDEQRARWIAEVLDSGAALVLRPAQVEPVPAGHAAEPRAVAPADAQPAVVVRWERERGFGFVEVSGRGLVWAHAQALRGLLRCSGSLAAGESVLVSVRPLRRRPYEFGRQLAGEAGGVWPEGTPVAEAGSAPTAEMLVRIGESSGAVLSRVQDVGPLMKCLRSVDWLRAAKPRTMQLPDSLDAPALPDGGRPTHAVFVSAPGAAALNGLRKASVPDVLVAALASSAVWCDGLRPGSLQPPRPPAPPGPPGPTFIELFAGVGGFRVGLEALGARCVFASEIDACARDVYVRNFGEAELCGDITAVDAGSIPDHDVLTAGFPCQSYSLAGNQDGLGDANGALFFEITRVVRRKRPRALLLENVANLAAHDDGETLRFLLRCLAELGYTVDVKVINSLALLPQQRERAYIVAVRADVGAGVVWPWLPELRACSRPHGRTCRCRNADLPRTVAEVLEPAPSSALTLTPSQWQRLQSSDDWAADKGRRLARVAGGARTLQSHYHTGHNRFSEFVPLGDGPPRFYSRRAWLADRRRRRCVSAPV